MARTDTNIIDHFSQESPIATEVRRLLHNVRAKCSSGELKALMVTSATTGEGKSTTCALMAITSAKKNLKTLLVDCDLRRPSLHRLFGFDRSDGLVEVLADGMSARKLVKRTSLDNLDLITAGKAWPHPTELFDSRAIGSIIDDLKFYYDFIIVDTPPVIPVSDPMLLAQELDGSVLVVKAGETPREVARRAAEIMTSNNTKLLGVVLNNARGSLPYYYDYNRYNYDYQESPSRRNNGSERRRKNDAAESPDAESQTNDKKKAGRRISQ